MGFSERCAASGLTIGYGERCLMFVIRPHWYLPLHYQSKWEPASLVPFRGTYNGESRMEDLDDTPAIRMQHRSLVVRSEVLEDRRDRWSKNIDEKMKNDLSTFCDVVERGELAAKSAVQGREFTAAPFYVREDVYNHIIEEQMGPNRWLGENTETHFQKLVKMRFETKERMRRLLQVGKETGEFDHMAIAENDRDLRDIDGMSRGQYLASHLMMDHEDLWANDEDAKISLAKAQVEFEMFAMGLEPITPWQPGHKSRCDNYEFLAKWHRKMAEFAEDSERRFQEL